MRGLNTATWGALALALSVGTTSAQPVGQTGLPSAPIPYAVTVAKSASTPVPAPKASAIALPAVATAAPIDPVRLEGFVDGWMADAMARAHVPGAAVSIVQNGNVVLKKGYGFADLAPRRSVDPDRSLFRIGSISKTFTWILLMKEVEAKRIRLDGSINLYLPEKVRLPGKGREVTVRSLMDHSSGFEDLALGQLFEEDSRRVRPLSLYLRQERPERIRPVGAISSYSNYGAALAGEAVAFTSGLTFERQVENEIVRPLGMSRTTFREPRPERRGLPAAMPQALRADLAKGYGWRAAGYQPNAYEYVGQIAPAGSASSTAADMSRYMLMLLGNGTNNDVTIFGPQTARAFRTPLRQEPPGINAWAHGFMTFDLPGGHRGYGHLGDTIAFHSAMIVVPDLALGIFVTTNGEAGPALTTTLPSAIMRNFYARPVGFPRPGSGELVEAARTFDGHYLTSRRPAGGLEGFVMRLVGGADVRVTSGGRLILSRGGQDQAFVPEGPVRDGRFMSALSDERIVFQMTGDHAESLRTYSNTETLFRTSLIDRQITLMVLALLTAVASISTLVGIDLCNRRDLRQNQSQARASMVQAMQAGLWLAAFALFGLWGLGTSNVASVMYNWPGMLVVTASACALVAAGMTLITLAAMPAIWQGGRRVDSWTVLRKTFFTATVIIYAAFSVLLAVHGGLEPWSG